MGIKLRAPHLKNIMGLVMGSCGLCLSEKKVVASCGNQVEGPSPLKYCGLNAGKFRAIPEVKKVVASWGNQVLMGKFIVQIHMSQKGGPTQST